VKLRQTLVCLALLLPALLAGGCTGGSTGVPTNTSAAPTTTSTAATTTTIITTTTTTLSQAQVTLQGMTPRQKAAQVLLLSFSGTALGERTSGVIQDGPPGGLLLLGANVNGAGQLRSLTAALQTAAAATGSPVGLLIAVDQEGGTVARIEEGVPDVPSARTLGTESTPAEAARLAADTAVALLNMGVNMNLAPVADVVSDSDSFLFKRTYGSDPALVSSFVTAVTEGYEDYGLVSVVKHFPGHGSATGNTHSGAVLSDADKAAFESVHLPPFQAAIAAGAEGVMVSHIVAKAYDAENPASSSASVVGGLLRETLAYDGLVVTDDLRMDAASGSASSQSAGEAHAAVAALNAGCDLLILTETAANETAVLDAIVQAVEAGTLSQERLDEAVLKVLELKYRHRIVAR
jgi:beta-N-acetylhexosaminidase